MSDKLEWVSEWVIWGFTPYRHLRPSSRRGVLQLMKSSLFLPFFELQGGPEPYRPQASPGYVTCLGQHGPHRNLSVNKAKNRPLFYLIQPRVTCNLVLNLSWSVCIYGYRIRYWSPWWLSAMFQWLYHLDPSRTRTLPATAAPCPQTCVRCEARSVRLDWAIRGSISSWVYQGRGEYIIPCMTIAWSINTDALWSRLTWNHVLWHMMNGLALFVHSAYHFRIRSEGSVGA